MNLFGGGRFYYCNLELTTLNILLLSLDLYSVPKMQAVGALFKDLFMIAYFADNLRDLLEREDEKYSKFLLENPGLSRCEYMHHTKVFDGRIDLLKEMIVEIERMEEK